MMQMTSLAHVLEYWIDRWGRRRSPEARRLADIALGVRT